MQGPFLSLQYCGWNEVKHLRNLYNSVCDLLFDSIIQIYSAFSVSFPPTLVGNSLLLSPFPMFVSFYFVFVTYKGFRIAQWNLAGLPMDTEVKTVILVPQFIVAN